MPSLPDNDQSCNPHLASLVAINIVTHVLNEAQDIVNTANDSGQSWRCVWRQKKRNSELYENVELSGIADSKVDECEINNNNVIITSTPQKQINVITKDYNESGRIGQGDEDVQTRNIDVRSPSILIDCLFDSNDLDQTESFEDNEDMQNDIDIESQDLFANTVTKLVESYINLAVNTACGNVLMSTLETNAHSIEESSSSSYSLLDDACDSDISGNVIFNSGDVTYEEKRNVCDTQLAKVMVANDDMEEIKKKDIDIYEKTDVSGNVTFNSGEVKYEDKRNVCDTMLAKVMVDNDDMEEIKKKDIDIYEKTDVSGNVTFNSGDVKYEEKRNVCDTQLAKVMVDNDDMDEIKKKDIDMYEKTYATLNRDYDKCSEEDFQEDQKSVSMHEVELPINIPSSEILAASSRLDQDFNLTIPRDNETVTNSTKNGLLKRCRLHGSRFISRLRSWLWKQRLIGKRKGNRTSLMPGMCPLSPKVRNRTASFLGHCKLRTPSPTGTCAWKFNTVNDVTIYAYKKKEFEMEINPTAPEEK